MTTVRKRTDKDESLEFLQKVLKPDMTVHVIIRHVSKSGMQRVMDVFYIKNNNLYCITHHVANVLEKNISKKYHGVVINGCGMDMAWHLVYTLSAVIFRGTKHEKQGENLLRHQII